ANIGQRLDFSQITITDGTNVVADDTFPMVDPVTEVDQTLWTAQCDAPSAVALKVVDQAAYWVNWNKPDGFLTAFEISSNLLSGWVDPGLTVRDMGTIRGIYATSTNDLVNYPDTAYFRLVSTNHF